MQIKLNKYSDTKRAVRLLTGSKYNSHTEPLFKQTNLLNSNDICNLNEIKLYYKLVNEQQPQYFNSFTHEANSDLHSHCKDHIGPHGK